MKNTIHKNWFIFFFLLFAGPEVQAQTLKAFVKAGDKAMESGDYNAALEHYQSAYEINSAKTTTAYKLAEVARLFYAYDIADEYYQIVATQSDPSDFPLLDFQRAEVAYGAGEYEKALGWYQQFIKGQGKSNSLYKSKAEKGIQNCTWAIEVIAESDNIDILHLNKRVNTPYTEFGPLLKGDSLYYSSMKYEYKKEDPHKPPRKYSKVLSSVKGAKGRPLTRGFNAKGKHTAHTTFTRDAKRVYYTLCTYLTDTQINCEIYTRDWNLKYKRWNKPKRLGDKINLKGSTATQPNVGFLEDLNKEYLFFVSDRPEGKGGLDIWCAEIKANGKCGKPFNLTDVNTIGNDITPFYHSSSGTLYFSSDELQGLGGYDIFKSERIDESWNKPVHTGYPLNSSFNDVYFSLDNNEKTGYFSSNRPGSFYLDKNNKACCNDIYRANFIEDNTPPTEEKLIDSLTLVDIPPIAPEIEVTIDLPIPTIEKVPETLEDFLPLALYFHNDEPDRRTRRTTTRKSYSETYHPYYALKGEYILEYNKPVDEPELKIQGEEELNNFFENKVKRGHDHLVLFSEILLKRLQQGEKVEIFIKGFTSPRAKSDYNLSLGKRRVSSLRNHFDTFAGQIFKSYIKSGQLIITERSFGETTAATGISDDLDDRRNSIYSVSAALERRVEIVEIKRGH